MSGVCGYLNLGGATVVPCIILGGQTSGGANVGGANVGGANVGGSIVGGSNVA